MGTPDIKRFGRYEIVEELGRGAMGVVYKARDPQIDRFVAVKTVSLWNQGPEEEREFRLRFANEAQAAGRLQHPGIVSVFDVGEDPENHDPYIVLEYVSGESLHKVLAREKKLPLGRALNMVEELADALDYAHAQGVIHRDIKPANILIADDGHAKIADFGIAKLNLAHFTIPGKVLGTPAYMAPEQLSGEGSDGRSDLFSLGVIFYVMITGHSPFPGSSATTVCFKVANREPMAASALDMTLPPQIDQVILRAIAKNREERYQRGCELADDLRLLQLAMTPSSTGSSLNLKTALTTSRNIKRIGASNSKASPLVVIGRARNRVARILQEAPVRDLILGAATLLLIVILGVQSRLLLSSPKSAGASPARGIPGSAQSESHNDAADSSVPTVPATRTAQSRASRKIERSSKQTQFPTATLDLAVQHQFKDASLFLYIDGRLVLTRPLHGAVQKKLVVFNGVRGVESDTISVPAGKHTIRVRALSTDQTTDLSKTVTADFAAGDNKNLHITFDKHNATMRLAWQ